jgi:benzodiazapine receptor
MRGLPYLPCLVGIILCLSIAGVSGWVTASSIDSWYQHLQQPGFTPPNWLFGPVWTVLYIMIGIAGGVLWQQRHLNRYALIMFIIQLILNFSWSFIFFGAKQIGWAAIDIILLWLSILAILRLTYSSSKMSFWLLAPYFLWVSFAAVLNLNLWVLNT